MNFLKNEVTLLQRFDGSCLIIGPEPFKRTKCASLTEARIFMENFGYQATIQHLHPASGGQRLDVPLERRLR